MFAGWCHKRRSGTFLLTGDRGKAGIRSWIIWTLGSLPCSQSSLSGLRLWYTRTIRRYAEGPAPVPAWNRERTSRHYVPVAFEKNVSVTVRELWRSPTTP